MRKLLFLLFTFSISFADVFFYDVKNESISFKVGKEAKADFDFGKTFFWKGNFFTRFRASKSTYTETDRLIGFPESRRSTTYDQVEFEFYPVGYTKKGFNISAGLNYIRLKRLEFGYVHFPPELNGEWVAFENRVKVNLLRPSISTEYRTGIKNIGFYGYIQGFFKSSGSIEQETIFKPIVETTGKNEGDVNSDFSYKAGGAISINFKVISLSIFSEYEFLDVKYDLAVLDVRDNTFFFNRTKVRTEERTTRYGGIIGFPFIKNSPYIGFYIQKLEVKDKDTGSKSTLDNKYIVFGFLF